MANWHKLLDEHRVDNEDYKRIARENGISTITAALLVNRNVTEDLEIAEFLHPDISGIQPYSFLRDMDVAARVMKSCIDNGDRIRVIGDYDVDGICSSFILLQGIKRCGGKVDVRLPHRMLDGYGLNKNLVDQAQADGVQTIITCDNGIAAINEIAYAKELGMTVVVTDHHEVGFENSGDEEADAYVDKADRKMVLPPADAVVDPKRNDNDPGLYENICGAVVAYKFICALTGEMSINPGEDFFKELRIFAGWATVCDVMPLEKENRVMVLDSFKNIKTTENTGLIKLIAATDLDVDKINYYSYGFVLGPCLNATGRLDSAERSLELLTETDSDIAAKLALELKKLNDERKDMTVQGTNRALEMLEEYGEDVPKVVVIYIPDLHESLAGIIAGKVREAVKRPTFIITDASEEGEVKGSGRSIDKYHMYEALCECKDLLTKFGGHKLAAGFSLKKENVDAFRKALNDRCMLSKADFVDNLKYDMDLPIGSLSLKIVKEFEKLGPFGTGNPEPMFVAKEVELVNGRILGKNANVGKIQVIDKYNKPLDMMVFQDIQKFNTFLDDTFGVDNRVKLYNNREHDTMKIEVLYRCSINEFRGEESLQIVLIDYKEISS
ncbi:MAG: single-stranded-DNA-specific exonuclease RecJ [Butyrivibrio sp.]|nr:single-stranded-DNA-specific exonuclease RecJ [Butyrivibrio sp.]